MDSIRSAMFSLLLLLVSLWLDHTLLRLHYHLHLVIVFLLDNGRPVIWTCDKLSAHIKPTVTACRFQLPLTHLLRFLDSDDGATLVPVR